jgi:hypothetical protein
MYTAKPTSILSTNREGIAAPLRLILLSLTRRRCIVPSSMEICTRRRAALTQGSYGAVVMARHDVIGKVHISSRSMLLSIGKVLEMVCQAALRH